MAENTVFLLLTALIRNFYKFLMGRLDTKAFGLKKTSRIKAFAFKFISVPAKWIRTARHYQLNIYTDNKSYQNPFALADGGDEGDALSRGLRLRNVLLDVVTAAG